MKNILSVDQSQHLSSLPLHRILEKLSGVRKSEKGYKARCPAHADTNPSLSITLGEDGRILLNCHAGCRPEAILKALGLEWRDLYPEPQAKPKPIAYYYRDEHGKVLFRVLRYPDKRFSQQRPDGQGGWINNLDGVKRTLYRLPEVLEAIRKGEVVYVVEGEKDAESLVALGLCATTNPGGAGKWRDEFSDLLQGGEVVILPDRDEPGLKHAKAVAASLRGKAESVKIVDFKTGKDITDWLEAGGTKTELLALVAQTPEWEPEPEPEPAEPEEPEEFTDRQNGKILAKALKLRLHWVPTWGWLVWDGRRWVRQKKGSATAMGLAANCLYQHYRAQLPNTLDPKAKKCLNNLDRVEKRRTVEDALEMAKAELEANPEAFDTEASLLNCENGLVDLKTGELYPHDPKLKITKLAPVKYNPDAKAPTWQRFLEEIFQGDRELINYVQRALGYSLTAEVKEDLMFICWGSGANGKTTLFNTVSRVLGDYADAVPISALVTKGGDTHPTALASLQGLRFAVASETDETQRLNEAQIKALTGRDKIRVRNLYQDYWTLDPTCKLWLATNHKPIIKDTSNAMWRRIALIPFKVTIPKKKQDPWLESRLLEEREGILAFLVEGAKLWYSQGLGECEAVKEATEAYREESDELQKWLAERCQVDPKAKTPFRDLYQDYCTWCGSSDPLGSRAFGNRLTEKGFEAIQLPDGTRARRGLTLRPAKRQSEPELPGEAAEAAEPDPFAVGPFEPDPFGLDREGEFEAIPQPEFESGFEAIPEAEFEDEDIPF